MDSMPRSILIGIDISKDRLDVAPLASFRRFIRRLCLTDRSNCLAASARVRSPLTTAGITLGRSRSRSDIEIRSVSIPGDEPSPDSSIRHELHPAT
jgi:hypothetical protein